MTVAVKYCFCWQKYPLNRIKEWLITGWCKKYGSRHDVFEIKVANFMELITTSIVPNVRMKNMNSWLPVQHAMEMLHSAFDNDIRRVMCTTNIIIGERILKIRQYLPKLWLITWLSESGCDTTITVLQPFLGRPWWTSNRKRLAISVFKGPCMVAGTLPFSSLTVWPLTGLQQPDWWKPEKPTYHPNHAYHVR